LMQVLASAEHTGRSELLRSVDVTPDLDQVRGLIAAIEKLNAEILETEKLVNSRAPER
jgi:hypothetical protein